MTTLSTAEEDFPAIVAAAESAGPLDEVFADRLDTHLPRLHDAVAQLVGDAADGQETLAALVVAASGAWHARTLELRVLDNQRLAEPNRLSSERMLGGVCDSVRYGGNLAGIRDELPYFRELGLTVLHLIDVLSDARTVHTSAGSLGTLVDLAADLRLAGIALMLDLRATGDVRALVDDALWLAGLGVEIVHTDAGADEVAVLDAVLAIAAPAVVVAGSVPACRLVDDARERALRWEALATGDPSGLQRALTERAELPADRARTQAVRDVDALSWPGLDDARRRFVTDFYLGRISGSFARGIPSPAPDADDPAVAGTTASLLGVEAADPAGEDRVVLAYAVAMCTGGIPMLLLGDEVAQLNDPTYADDPARRDDARWTHRGNKPRDRYAERGDLETAAGRVFARFTKLRAVRATAPEFAGDRVVGFDPQASGVLGFQRPGADTVVLVLANVGATRAIIEPLTLSGFEAAALELIAGADIDLAQGLVLPPLSVMWVRAVPA